MPSDFLMAGRVFRLSDESYRTRRSFLTVTSLVFLYQVAEISTNITMLGTSVELPRFTLGLFIFLIAFYFFFSFLVNVLQDLKDFRRDELVIVAKELNSSVIELVSYLKQRTTKHIIEERDRLVKEAHSYANEWMRFRLRPDFEQLDTSTVLENTETVGALLAKIAQHQDRWQKYYDAKIAENTIDIKNKMSNLEINAMHELKEVLLDIEKLRHKQLKLYRVPNSMHTFIDIWIPFFFWIAIAAWSGYDLSRAFFEVA